MSSHLLEWAWHRDGGPRGWWLLRDWDANRKGRRATPAWPIHSFYMGDRGFLFEYHFRGLCEDDPGIAVYDAEEWHCEIGVTYPGGEVYVRVVPTAFVVTCSLALTESRSMNAVFTTLGGSEMLRICVDIGFCMDRLTRTAAIAAASQGRLQSRNQAVQVTWVGNLGTVDTLIIPDVIWDELQHLDAQRD